MNQNISPKITALTFGVLTIAFLAVFYVVAWQEPGQAPPSGNVDTPLNIGWIGQSKKGNLMLNASGTLANGLLVPYGNVGIGTVSPGEKLEVSGGGIKAESVTVVGSGSLPVCNASYRGKQYLLQSGSGTEDGLYVCKKKVDDTYAWIALASPPTWVSSALSGCEESTKVSYKTGGFRGGGCCIGSDGTCYYNMAAQVIINGDGTRTISAWGNYRYQTGCGSSWSCCGLVACWSSSAYNAPGTAKIW